MIAALRHRAGRWVAILLCAVSPGCYRYAPVATDAELPRATPVRAQLDSAQDFPLGRITANNVDRVQGEYIGWRSDSLGVSAFLLTSPVGYKLRLAGETVRIPRDNVAVLERREFDSLRTGLLVAAGAAVLVATGAALVGGGSGAGDGGPPVPPD